MRTIPNRSHYKDVLVVRTSYFANRPDLRSPKRSLWLTGHMSPLAKRNFQNLGWVINEKTAGLEGRKDTP
jgi:hypothetical protein